MRTIRGLLQVKGHDVWSVGPETTVYDAIKLMADKEIGALLVIEEGILRGIVSERDYARKVILKGKSSRDTQVKEIMTPRVIYVGLDETVEKCLALMTAKRIRHLPVIADKEVVGIVSIGDLVKAIISEQKIVIEQLESYIAQHTSMT